MTQNMVIGISHRVVKYSVVQKIAELKANHYLKPSTNQTHLHLDCKIIKSNKKKSLPVTSERCLHSSELFTATNLLKGNVIHLKGF